MRLRDSNPTCASKLFVLCALASGSMSFRVRNVDRAFYSEPTLHVIVAATLILVLGDRPR
jgi:hypothetical protein